MQKLGNSKGQAALEYMSIVGFALLILAGILVFAYNYTLSARESQSIAAASATVNNIVESANLVYAQGYPAKVTVVASIPQNVVNATFQGNVLRMQIRVKGGITDVAAAAKVNLTGMVPLSPGYYKLQIQSLGDTVNVTRIF